MEVQYGEWPTNPIWINYRLFRINLLTPLVIVINMIAISACFTPIVKISDIIKTSFIKTSLFDIRAGNSNLAKSLSEKINHAMYQDENPHRGLLSLQNCQN